MTRSGLFSTDRLRLAEPRSGKLSHYQRFGLTNQMRRAAVSISSNLAEGSSRSSRPDFARFVEITTGSLFEVISQGTISKRRGFLSETDFSALYAACEKQSKMLSGLRKSLLEHSA